jgi:hypothetical protein
MERGLLEMLDGLLRLYACVIWFAPLPWTIAAIWSWFRNAKHARRYDNEVFPLMDEDPRSWELSPTAHAMLRRRAIFIARFGGESPRTFFDFLL